MLKVCDVMDVFRVSGDGDCVVVLLLVCMTMSKGIVALFSTSGRPIVPFVHMDTGNTFSMPYITTGPSVNNSLLAGRMTADVTGDETGPAVTGSVTVRQHLSLHIRPLVHGAMLAVIHRHRWTVVYYLYDSDHGMFTSVLAHRTARGIGVVLSSVRPSVRTDGQTTIRAFCG